MQYFSLTGVELNHLRGVTCTAVSKFLHIEKSCGYNVDKIEPNRHGCKQTARTKCLLFDQQSRPITELANIICKFE